MGRSGADKFDQKYRNLSLAALFTQFGLFMDRFDCFMPKT